MGRREGNEWRHFLISDILLSHRAIYSQDSRKNKYPLVKMPGFSIRWGQNAGTLDGPALQRLIPLKIHLSLPSFPLLWCQPTTLQRCILWFGVCVCVSAHSNFCPTEGSLLLWPAPCHKNLFGDPLPLHPEAQASGNDQQSCPASPKCLAHSECRFSQGSQITALIHHKKQPLGHKLFQEKNKFSIFAGGGTRGRGTSSSGPWPNPPEPRCWSWPKRYCRCL